MLSQLVQPAVHTTGINWDGFLANAAYITAILGTFGALMLRAFKRSVKDQVSDVLDAKIVPRLERMEHTIAGHDTRLARLEGVTQGRREAIDAAGVTTTASTAI